MNAAMVFGSAMTSRRSTDVASTTPLSSRMSPRLAYSVVFGRPLLQRALGQRGGVGPLQLDEAAPQDGQAEQDARRL